MQQHDLDGPPATEDLPDSAWTPLPPPVLNARAWGLLLLERFGFWIACAVTITVIGFVFLNADQFSPKEPVPNPTAERGPGAVAEAPDAGVPGGVPLSITTEPVDAAIFIDGAYVGVSPVRAVALTESRHLIAVVKPSYAPLDTFVTLGKAPASLQLTLHNAETSRAVIAPPTAAGTDLTAASGKARQLDREQPTPVLTQEEASAETGQAGQQETPAAVAEAPVAVVEEPAAADEREQRLGTLRILVKPWGAIYIDGTLHKSESTIWYAAKLPPGTHRVGVEHPSLGRRERVVAVAAGEERALTIDLNKDE